MRNALIFAAGAAVFATSAATADISGLRGQDTLRYYAADGSTETDLAGASYAVIDLYAQFNAANTDGFNNADSHMLSAFNWNFTSSTGSFEHSDLTGAAGSWKPSFSFDIPGSYDSMQDSYVTIGYGVGAAAALNQTALDPGFGTGSGGQIPQGTAGWFNLTPDNPQYAADNGDGTYSLQVGHFVFAADTTFTFDAEIGFNDGPGTEVSFGEGVFTTVPAPGALALLGLAGIAGRRRRA